MLRPPDDRRHPADDNSNPPSPSPNVRRLFLRMRRQGYGTIHGVRFRDGDALFDRPFQVIRKVRTTEKAWPHRNLDAAEFMLTREHLRFIEELSVMGSGVVDVKVVNGLPVDLDFHERS